MKNLFKKVLPVLLVLLILVSIVWYCFIYDRNFTRDLLLGQARYHSTGGNPVLASWFYNTAYELSDQDEHVAIELANQFRAAGNYTKAEYTLTHAIADGGDSELYVALCKTYVEKDKLLDAVNMLDSIADPVIKAELDAMRPAAPVAEPAPGFYSEYIPVTLSANDGTVYYSTDIEYPSTEDAPYTEPFTLPAGETVIRAVTVSSNGLVSPLATFTYTVNGVIEEVSFTDQVIDTYVRQLISADEDDTLFTNMLWDITSFTVPEGAMNLQELSKLPYLQELIIQDYTFDSVSFLAGLSKLETLSLSGCRFPAKELEIIAGLPALKQLTMNDCGLSTISGLENAQGLVSLDMSENTIRNLEPLSALMNLQSINLTSNAVTNLSALSSLANLETLDVSYNALSSLSPIATCRNLKNLLANNNTIVNLDALDNLPSLEKLDVHKNSLTDISVLNACTALVELDIGSNSIEDISALDTLVNLEIFTFSSNRIAQLPSWPDGCKLRSIDGSYNQVESLSPLKNMHSLTHVFMDYNALTSVDTIADCYNLVQVNVYGNEIENVDALKERDIIVNWDPTAAED